MRPILFAAALAALALAAPPPAAAANQLVYVKTFTDYAEGSVGAWLQGKGFKAERDARRRDRIDLDVDPDKGLIVEAKRPVFGILANESVNVAEFTAVEIDWGVEVYPQGASYEQEVRNEALMVILFMGDKRRPSGSIFIPDSPYFVGLFLCHGDDREDHAYVGKYFQKSGRYVCPDKPAPGETVTSRFDLLAAYRSFFDKPGGDSPGISGLALATDTQKAGNGGVARAFIREVRFYR